MTNKKDKDELGLESLADLFPEQKGKKPYQKDPDAIQDYEIYNFLEVENKRLEKIDLFYGSQINTLKRFFQVPTLIDKQKEEAFDLRKELLEEVLGHDDLLEAQLRETWDHFIN